MHEFGLAQALVEQLVTLAREHGGGRIRSVRVEIGDQAGIVVDSFCFGFTVISRELPLTSNARLQVDRVAGRDLILRNVEMEEVDV